LLYIAVYVYDFWKELVAIIPRQQNKLPARKIDLKPIGKSPDPISPHHLR
jgi:hypothetical protein